MVLSQYSRKDETHSMEGKRGLMFRRATRTQMNSLLWYILNFQLHSRRGAETGERDRERFTYQYSSVKAQTTSRLFLCCSDKLINNLTSM